MDFKVASRVQLSEEIAGAFRAQQRLAITGVILAGGLARRLGGGDKCLLPLAGQPLLAQILARLRPQVGRLLLNANGAPERFVTFGLPVVADSQPDFAGPLAGLLASMEWAQVNAPAIAHIVTVPGDSPFIPVDLVMRLSAAAEPIAYASYHGQSYPVVGLWPVALAGELRRALVEEGLRKVESFALRCGAAVVAWDELPHDPFFNINNAADLAAAERRLKAAP